MRLLPGDQLWDRYRVDSVSTSRCDAALLSALQKAGEQAGARYRLISLAPDSQHPLSDLLLAACRAVRGGALLAIEAATRRKRGSKPPATKSGQLAAVAPGPHDERPALQLIGKAEWIGEPGEDAIAIVELPETVVLKQVLAGGAPDGRQILWLFKQLAEAAEFWTRLLSDERATRELSAEPVVLLARQLQAERLQLRRDNTRLVLNTACVAPKLNGSPRPPAFAYQLAPEVYNGNVSSQALTFAVARTVAALLMAEPAAPRQTRRLLLAEQNKKPAEAEWAALAAWTAGKRDPAAEFKDAAKQLELPNELRTLLVRCLARTPARRPSLTQLIAALNRLATAAWASGDNCQGCGLPLRPNWARECPCCGRPVSIDAELRRARRATATIARRSTQNLAAVERVPEKMALIAGGPFLSGERKVPRTLRDFAIDKTPVTEGDYKKFLNSVKRNARPGGPGSKEPLYDNHPVTQISWYEANEFAEFYGKRLPTVYEWEKAARGLDGRKFPYGETFRSAGGRLRLPVEGSTPSPEENGTVPVGTFTAGASPYGVFDMAGNVLEWTSSARRAGERLYRALKGACYRDGSSELARCTSIQYLPPESVEPFIGFRCVKDLD